MLVGLPHMVDIENRHTSLRVVADDSKRQSKFKASANLPMHPESAELRHQFYGRSIEILGVTAFKDIRFKELYSVAQNSRFKNNKSVILLNSSSSETFMVKTVGSIPAKIVLGISLCPSRFEAY